MPAMTSALSVCPEGKDGEYSYGGTASASGGRVRPINCLPAIVISSAPTPAAVMRMTGVHDRRRIARTTMIVVARIGIPITPPMSV